MQGLPYEDEIDLTEKLQRVLRDGSLVQSYRNRAQVRVQKFYDWEHVVDEYEQVFADLAGISLPRTTTYEEPALREHTVTVIK